MKPAHIRAHRRIWLVLAVLVPLGLAAALAAKYSAPADAPAIRLAPPAGQG